MALPSVLKAMNLSVDGVSHLAIVDEFTPAKLARKLESYRSGGMQGGVSIDLGFDDGALDVEFTLGGYEASLVKKLSTGKIDGVQLRFAGAFQDDSTTKYTGVEVVVRGRLADRDLGTLKVGEKGQQKHKFLTTYYREDINGQTAIEVDLINNIYTVDGKDLMAEIRQILGF